MAGTAPCPRTTRNGRLVVGAIGDAAPPHDIELDDARTATLPRLPAGEFRILVATRGGELETMRFHVRVAHRVVFVAEPITAPRAMITDPTGTLGRFGLRHGALIIATDGRKFTDLATMQGLLAEGLETGGLMLTLLRWNERRRAPLPGSALADPTEKGGVLEPVSR